VRWRILVPAAAAAVAVAALILASRGDSRQVLGTIGDNDVPIGTGGTSYRLTFDGRATRIGGASTDGLPPNVTAPGGRYRLEFLNPGKAVVDTRTGERRVVTSDDGSASWGPRGTLAFTDRHDGLTRLVIFNPAAGTRRVIGSHLCGEPAWSPDGRRLAVAVSPPGGGCGGQGHSEVLVLDDDGGGRQRIAEPPSARPVAWSQSGSGLLIAVQDGLDAISRLVDLRTGKAETVLRKVSMFGPGAWSPGRRFYAAIAVDRSSRKQVVVVVRGSLRRVVRTVAFGQQFAWSAKRQWLAITEGKRIRVLDAVTGRTVATIPVNTLYGYGTLSLAWGENERSLIAAVVPSVGHD
jgi:dipeptidyl aminopeptidase/acylaminoacyl peptidase